MTSIQNARNDLSQLEAGEEILSQLKLALSGIALLREPSIYLEMTIQNLVAAQTNLQFTASRQRRIITDLESVKSKE